MFKRTPRQRRRFILKLVRLQNAIARAEERAAEQYEMDSLVDAGEFSGAVVHRALLRETQQIVQRFGFTHPEWAESAIDYMRCRLPLPAHLVFGGAAPLPR